MKKKEIIKLGTKLGLSFNEKTNFKDSLARDIVVFDGCNDQRFLIDGRESDTKIYKTLGESLILYGKRLKAMEIHSVLSINSD